MNDAFQKRVDVTAVTIKLAEILPKCVFVYEKRRRPLQVGIRDAIAERVGDLIAPEELNIAMRAYVKSVGYLQAVARGDARISIDGQPAGEPTIEQRAAASKAVASFFARRAERKAAARLTCSSSETPAPIPETPDHDPSTGEFEAPVPIPETPAGPKRLGLADLRQLARERKEAAQ